jgi:hypothetical protein
MNLHAEVVRTRMDSAASPHHRIVSRKSGNGVDKAAQPAAGAARDGFGGWAGRSCPGGSGAGSSPRPPLPEPVQSGDVVRTRIDAAVSPHRASGDEAPYQSGENPHGKRRLTTSPDDFRQTRTRRSRGAHGLPRTGTGRARPRVGTGRPGGLAGGSSPCSFATPEKRSGDVVRTRMNAGASPLHGGAASPDAGSGEDPHGY